MRDLFQLFPAGISTSAPPSLVVSFIPPPTTSPSHSITLRSLYCYPLRTLSPAVSLPRSYSLAYFPLFFESFSYFSPSQFVEQAKFSPRHSLNPRVI